jgi:transcriptional regulator with XRE-family HTH domain
MARRGRPSKKFTDEQVATVERMAQLLTQEQIADFLGISDRQLRRKIMSDERFLSAYSRGRARAISGVAANLIQAAQKGNLQAMQFYLRTQAGWKDAQAPQTQIHVDLDQLSDEQLERIAAGEDPARVLASS